MPKKPINFSKTIIYKIWKDDNFYVGSTTDFASRKSKHKGNCNNKKSKEYNYKLYQTIRENGGWDTWKITPLEEYIDCQNSTQARIKEEEWRVKLNASLNTRKAFIAETIQEYKKQYHQEHKEEINEKKTQYRQEYADVINAKKAVPYCCQCGSTIRISDKARHEKTIKHQKYLEKK